MTKRDVLRHCWNYFWLLMAFYLGFTTWLVRTQDQKTVLGVMMIQLGVTFAVVATNATYTAYRLLTSKEKSR